MDNETKKHALLGASSSHRWLNCTPSAVAESRYPDEGSEFAREGSMAHAMAACEIKRQLGRHVREEIREMEELREYHTGEMDEHVAGYAAYVADRYRQARERASRRGGLTPEICIEQRLDYSRWVPGGFGTGDTVIAGDGEVEVIDLKYGKGVEVKAEGNTQMMLYALGAIELLDYLYDIDTVVMTIYQPRLGNVSSWSMPVKELMRWAEEELRPLAMLADRGKGIRSSGTWCRFCKAKGDCPRLAAESMETWQLNADAETLDPDDLARVLAKLDTVADWVSAVKERALARALEGTAIPGFKVVEGRSIRKVTDPGTIVERMSQDGVPEASIFKPRELRTITDLEKAFGKRKFAEYAAGCVAKPQGKPALVPETDKRPALDAASDFREALEQEA